MDVLVEEEISARYSDGHTAPIRLRIGRPYPHPKGDWACPVQAEGLQVWKGPNDIFGISSWNALMLGIRFLRSTLTTEINRGTVLFWAGGEEVCSVQEVFPFQEDK